MCQIIHSEPIQIDIPVVYSTVSRVVQLKSKGAINPRVVSVFTFFTETLVFLAGLQGSLITSRST